MVMDTAQYTIITVVDEPTPPHSPRSLAQIGAELQDQQMKLEPAQNQDNQVNNNLNAIIIAPINNNNAVMPHHEAVCHVCDNVIVGIRYKCFECIDYVSNILK